MRAYQPLISQHHQPPPSVLQLLEQLPYLHNQPTNHSNIIDHLRLIIERWHGQTKNYMSVISNYLMKNMEQNVKLLETMDCLVYLHSDFSIPFKQSISDLLEHKYPCVETDQQISKLKAINQSLIEPFLCLFGKIEEWFELEIIDRQYKHINPHQFYFLVQFMYIVTKFQFQEEMQLEGRDLSICLLTIYRVIEEDQYLLNIVFQNESNCKKLAISIFYFLTNYQIQEQMHAEMVFEAISQLISIFHYHEISFEDIIFKQLLRIVRKQAMKQDKDHSSLISLIQHAFISILAINWSFDQQYKFSWKTKILWDLLVVKEQDQAELIKELQQTSEDLTKYLKLK